MSDQGRLVAGRYRLAETIGRGGMGTVWRAEDELLGRQVAVKKLRVPPQLHDDERERLYERTRREARSAARIAHPNVVVVHDVVEDEGLPCIVMEYVPSRTLSDVLKKDGPISPREAARIGRGMVAALRAAHRAGVLHRDVKPANVLLGLDDSAQGGSWPGGRVVLTDFGIATATGTSTLTRTGELVGSFDYLAPERITGGTPGPASDLWALGATLYQAVEGVAPFHRDTPIETAYAIASEPVATPRRAGALTPVIESLLAKQPEDRMTAEQVERLLVSSVETLVAYGSGQAAGPAADVTEQRRAPSWALRDDHPDAPEVLVDDPDLEADPGDDAASDGQDVQDPREQEDDTRFPDVGAPGAGYARRSTSRVPPQGGGPQQGASATVMAGGGLPAVSGGGGAVRTGHGDPDGPASGNTYGGQDVTAAPGAGRRRRRGPVVLVALVLVAAIATGGVLLARHFGVGQSQTGGHGTPTSAPDPTSSVSTGPGGAQPTWPAGYHEVNDPMGFAMAVPDGWTREVKAKNGEVDFIAPGGLTGLKVSILDYAGPSPLQHWEDLQKVLEGDDQDYSLLRMNATTVTVGGAAEPAAIWEWTWQGQVRVFHAIDLGFGVEGGTQYAVYLSAPDGQWTQQLPAFNVAVQTFRPQN